MIKQSSKRFYSMILSVAFLAGSLLMFFELIQPAYSNVQALKGKELSMQDSLEKEKTIIEQAKQLIAQYQSESQAQDNLALAMPSGPNVAAALAELYGIAQNNGTVISGMSVSLPTIQLSQGNRAAGSSLTASQVIKPRGTISIQVTALGGYENMKNFLAQLETNIRIFDLTGFSIQPPSGVSTVGANGKAVPQNPDLFGYTFAVATYYQLP